ncbi:hypothetical protein PACTADRAFT_18565 [Pachysolen tannophilus NRRL Y-2460]|uniref:C3H1-type domain-containing protein n=1 Tax=Pachysolen tannophilus NRRL Y-2460 TaxID=669874 RepID=A0A1E4TQE2_PACTA|nr:hypothetical protein PACTADRAFT_18565 [Pachysolen tannophilus NRRL Y-2460]
MMSEENENAEKILAKMQLLQESIESSKKSIAALHSKKTYSVPLNKPKITSGELPARKAVGFPKSSFFRSRPAKHRNISLVLNNDINYDDNNNNTNTNLTTTTTTTNDSNIGINQGNRFVSKVSKNGLSLVNTKIYENDQKRKLELAKKINDLKIEKLKHLKKLKILKKIKELTIRYDYCNRCKINGISFIIAHDGLKLIPINYIEDIDHKNTINYNNCDYLKLQDGSYLKKGFTLQDVLIAESQEPCRFYTRTGICTRGSTCKFKHDPQHLSLCKAFLKNQCHNNPNCLLSHRPTQYNSPSCKFFNNGNCTNLNCLFTHKLEPTTNPEIPVCRNFAIGGYCPKGKSCELRHDFSCPDFIESGLCPRGKNCKLNHFIVGTNNETGANAGDGSGNINRGNVVRNEDNDLTSSSSNVADANKNKMDYNTIMKVFDNNSSEGEEEDGEENILEEDDDGVSSRINQVGDGDLEENIDYVKI